ncbi:medium-chain fatty acid-CoA ligase faa2 [Coemansia sp. RSA 2702]|nr:medium-chain fatty acid-CoA ligase faa2 [Coemansia sp. RSA 2704]KAJ2330149.1 medium-chain fatty acid-CoA ligase faa2 [Coemansia sp. RSA 2702]KAJ2738511.1 medium-chain fatty acid-CoA ligase faa2 [Coemansia sp. Cherry 401B]
MAAVDPAVIVAASLAVVAGAVYLYYYSPQANQPDLHPLQMAQQAAVSDTRESARESAVFRSKAAAHGLPLHAMPSPRVADLRALLRAGRDAPRADAALAVAGDRLLRVSTDEVARRAAAVAGALVRMDARAAAILLPSSTDFLVVYQACIEAGVAAIPLAFAEPADSVKAVLLHAQPQVLLTTAERAQELAPALGIALPPSVVVAGDPDKASGVRNVAALAELEQGAALDADVAIAPSDTAYVLYSCDGPKPQGVAVSHANALAAVAGVQDSVPPAQALGSADVFMSAAPASSAPSLALLNAALLHGCAVALCETADAEQFAERACEVRPTLMYLDPPLVRDLVQLFYTSTLQYPWLERCLFRVGFRRVADALLRGVWPKAGLWHLMYFRHFRGLLGARLRLVHVDARATPSSTLEWLRVLYGARVVPVFGPAQTAGAATAGLFFDYASAVVAHNAGVPLTCNEIKLVDAPDVGLTADDAPNPRGAVAVRGPNVAPGRWNEDSASLKDGWLLLPVFAESLPNGVLEVLGTRASIVRSSLAPAGTLFLEELERACASSSAVVDVCIAAAGSSKLDVVVYPRPMELHAAAKRLKKEYVLAQIDDYPWCADYIRDRMVEAASQAGCEWLAQVPAASIRVKLVSEQFSIRNGLVLADGQNNRPAVRKLLARP